VQTYELLYALSSSAAPLVAVTLIASNQPANVLEFGITYSGAAVAADLVFGIPATTGTGSAGTALQALNPSDPAASTTMVVGAHATTQPTAPANPFRRFTSSLTPTGGVIWGWDHGELIIPTGGQLVLWIAVGTITLRGYAKVAEGG
jgi:hypothetical protein